MKDKHIKNRIVEKLLRSKVLGSKKIRVDTAVNRHLPSHEQGRGKEVIREMIRDPDGAIEGYGGSRDNIRLTSKEDAVEFLKSNDGNVPFGFD